MRSGACLGWRDRMPKSKSKWKEPEMEKVIDSFEGWLEKQQAKPVRAKHGFIAEEKIEGSQ